MIERGLILSGSFGKGHDVVGEACAAALSTRGVHTQMVDSITLMGARSATVGDRVFRTLLAVPPLYDAFHFTQLRGDGPVGRRFERLALDRLYPAVRDAVEREQAGLVVSVFATGAGAAARLKRQERPDLATVVVMTDSYAHLMWVHEGTDLFLVTSDLAAASIRRYQPHARVRVMTGPPVRPQFHHVPDREEARRTLGVPTEARCALLMSGAWGIGPLDGAAAALADRGCWVLAVAGSNVGLADRLAALAHTRPSVIPFGFTDRIPELMAASDVVVTSSGDTCREARVVGRGIVLLDVVPGHGRENLMHELELGGAAVARSSAEGVRDAVVAFLDAGAGRDIRPQPAEGWTAELIGALTEAGIVAGA